MGTNVFNQNEFRQPPEPYFGWGAEIVGVEFGPRIYGGRVCQGPSLLGAEFVRGRVC